MSHCHKQSAVSITHIQATAEAQAAYSNAIEERKAAAAAHKAAEGGAAADGSGEAAAGALPPGLKVEDAFVLANPGIRRHMMQAFMTCQRM